MKLLAVDGNSILNRAYYGIKLLSTKEGIYTNGIYGFLTILLKMLQEVEPQSVAIAFDMRAKTFRHKLDENYKAGRKGMPEELAGQLPILKELLGFLGYKIVECEGYEADDILGTVSAAACAVGCGCVIATGDRDSFQLVNNCVTVRLASTKGGRPNVDIIDEAAILVKYNLVPKQLIDLKALMGDSSDNISGVAGVGEKTALELMQKFENLDNIYDNLDSIDIRDSLREKLRKGKDAAYLSRKLAEIDCNVPVLKSPSDYPINPPDMAKAAALMQKLEMFSLMPRFGISPQAAPAADTDAEEEEETEGGLEIIFGEPLEMLFDDKTQLVDLLFSFEDEKITAVCVIKKDGLYLYDQDVEQTARNILESPVKKRTNKTKLVHRYAIANGFSAQNIIFDAEIAGYILNPNGGDYSLSRLAAEYAIIPLGAAEALGSFSKLVEDCAIFTPLADLLEEKIANQAQYKLFTDIEMPLAEVLADMELAGFSIDIEGLKIYGEKIDGEISRQQTEIFAFAGETFNINSPKQLGAILFEKLGLPTKKKTKTGYSTNADVLDSLRGQHQIIEHILTYRQMAKLKSTYVDGLLKQVMTDGKIHTSFQQTLTRTGRISSTEPNLQNIPTRTDIGSELRSFFKAGGDNILLDADYSQIELRVLAHIADDQTMLQAFRDNQDIHTSTAAQVFDMPLAMVTPLMRNRAKAVNFGIVYGIGAFSLAQDIGVSVSEADSYIKQYLANFSGVKEYMEESVAFAKEHGYVKTLLGRRRYLPEISMQNRAMREFGKRVAMNMPIQGTAADIIKIAMVRVYQKLKEANLSARLILQIHDELIVECPPQEKERAAKILQQEMEAALEMNVPLEAEVSSGKNWLEAK